MFFHKLFSKVTVNKQTYSGRNIKVVNGKVIVDGNDVTPIEKEIHITVEGSLENLDVDACSSIKISGDVQSVKSGAGDVSCRDVGGNVSTGSGDVECGNVNGDVETGAGDVRAGNVGGSIKTGAGDIYHRGDKRN